MQAYYVIYNKYVFFHRCNLDVDVDQLKRLNNSLRIAIEMLKKSQQDVQKRLVELKNLMGELPTEETSPYKKCSISMTNGTDIDTVVDDFIFAYTSIVFLANDVISTIELRSTLKLLAIQRTYESYMGHLEKSKFKKLKISLKKRLFLLSCFHCFKTSFFFSWALIEDRQKLFNRTKTKKFMIFMQIIVYLKISCKNHGYI